ncbi:hypothetical protein L0337_29900 [candidate division KSB1 bacterium]|nr:hypothetical protein [candidate division KSB1 bacterium]
MTNNSLLELETVRRRIEQLDGERQGLSDLIKKLKQIRDTMTSLQKELDAKKTDMEKWLRDFKQMALSISANAAESNHQFSASMQLFGQKAETLLQEMADSASQLKARGEEQARENSLDSTGKGLNKHIDEINQTVNELRQRLLEEQKAFKEAVQKGIMAQFGKIQKQVDGRMNEMSTHLDEVRNGLAQKEKSSKQAIRFLWIGIIVSFLLGGISTAALLIGLFGK